jgi:hypothetical protein
MSKVILDDAQKEQLARNGGPAELCDRDGRTVAIALSPEEYHRLLYDLAWAEFSTPQAEAERQASLDEIRRGNYVTSEQLFEELRQLGYMPRAEQ